MAGLTKSSSQVVIGKVCLVNWLEPEKPMVSLAWPSRMMRARATVGWSSLRHVAGLDFTGKEDGPLAHGAEGG